MSTGFPHFTHSAKQGELGVNIVSRVISDTFGWLFKRNHQEHDFGIDGQIELVTDIGEVTGQMLAVQIKCGKSFFTERNKWGFIYRGEKKHFNYLANYPIPVLICICDPGSQETYWVHFKTEQAQITDAAWKITVPFENTLSSSKAALIDLVPPLFDSLTELDAYWATNKLMLESSTILYVLDKYDVRTRDVLTPRVFFNRLRATKELAYECQGKVEISFSGYDDDPRELYEIDEVRRYISLLDAALPDLFFFARTERPTFTLTTFALCQTNVSFENGRSTRLITRQVSFDTDKVATFFECHWPGLNEMTDWLGMSIDDNKKITFAIVKCLGFAPSSEEDGE